MGESDRPMAARSAADREAIRLDGVSRTFVLHLRGGARLPVIEGATFSVLSGECVVLGGPSGAGKSSILKMIYGNYRTDAGAIRVRDGGRWIDVATATAREILMLRRTTIGYVSQFLRTIPRVSALDIVSAEARDGGVEAAMAEDRAKQLLARLNLPERLWGLPPATFSGGEQQRVNIARGFAAPKPILLLDEPTTSLDAANRAVVVELVAERKQAGAAVVGIFHDGDVRERIASRVIDVTRFAPRAAAEV